MQSIKSIDLFAGAGGLSEGLRLSGIKCIWANEFDKHAAQTFQENFPESIVDSRDVREFEPSSIREQLGLKSGEIDLIVGGPPCQGFSTYGQRDTDDPRNQLYVNFFNFIDEFSPKMFVMENVLGILSMDDGLIIKDIQERAVGLGYRTSIYTAKAEEFGVPQKRRRVFILGTRLGPQVEFIAATHSSEPSNLATDLFSERTQAVVTLRDAISDLVGIDVLEPAQTQQSLQYLTKPSSSYQESMRAGAVELTHHSAKRMLGIRSLRLALLRPGDYGAQLKGRIEGDGLSEEMIDQMLSGTGLRDLEGCRREDVEKEGQLRKMLHEGHHTIDEILAFVDPGGFKNKYRRLDWDEPSHTLVAHMARDCSDFVHPELNRFISVREAARLQSFPDRFVFPGSQFQQFKQIGNAVPPLLGYAVGQTVCRHLTSHQPPVSPEPASMTPSLV